MKGHGLILMGILSGGAFRGRMEDKRGGGCTRSSGKDSIGRRGDMIGSDALTASHSFSVHTA